MDTSTVRGQVLDLINKEPGITAATIVERLSTSPNRIYIVVRDLAAKGTIKVEVEQIEGTRLKVRACYPV